MTFGKPSTPIIAPINKVTPDCSETTRREWRTPIPDKVRLLKSLHNRFGLLWWLHHRQSSNCHLHKSIHSLWEFLICGNDFDP